MTDKELMQQALDVLETKERFWAAYRYEAIENIQATITALRDRLAQTNEFEPDWDAMAVMVEEQQRMAKRIEELDSDKMTVAWKNLAFARLGFVRDKMHPDDVKTIQRFLDDDYTIPQRKPLTDEEIYLAINQIDKGERGWSIRFARAIEAAHGIK